MESSLSIKGYPSQRILRSTKTCLLPARKPSAKLVVRKLALWIRSAQNIEYHRIPGLQEFASGVWERQRRIPKNTFNDPLKRLFEEFDADGDGHISAQELADALQSRGVQISEEQAQGFIDKADKDGNRMVEKNEFPKLLYKMATEDRLSSSMASIDA